MLHMARGWESKSVEAQIEEATSSESNPGERSSPSPREVQQQLKRADLLLSRKRILQQLEVTSSERYSEMLRRSLSELDSQLGS
jgi:hypothetical protein